MITKITIDNFKAHAHTEVALEPFTVLVGANGVGKTSVLEALHIVGQSLSPRKSLAELLQGPWRPDRILRESDGLGILSVLSGDEVAEERRVTVRFEVDLGGVSG